MRKTFIDILLALTEKDNRIFLLTGDLGFSVLEKFREKFPDRFFDMGVAEQNMIGFASGLALSGKIVFVYSIVPFVTMRCFEQIRNDLCYHNLNVRIIGVGGGLSYGSAGFTHHSIEDNAIMRALPNMTVVCPGDTVETELVIKNSLMYQGPMYIRLGKDNDPRIHSVIPKFKIGNGILMDDGKDVTIITTGNTLELANTIVKQLNKKGIYVRFISMPTIKPIDTKIILESAFKTKLLITLEEHNIIGGLGSAVAELLMDKETYVILKRIALPDKFIKNIGSQNYLREKQGLSVKKIVNIILKELRFARQGKKYAYSKGN